MGSGIYLANQMVESLLMAHNGSTDLSPIESVVRGKAEVLGNFDARCPVSGALSPSV